MKRRAARLVVIQARLGLALLSVALGTVGPISTMVLGYQVFDLGNPRSPAFLFPLMIATAILIGVSTAGGVWILALQRS